MLDFSAPYPHFQSMLSRLSVHHLLLWLWSFIS